MLLQGCTCTAMATIDSPDLGENEDVDSDDAHSSDVGTKWGGKRDSLACPDRIQRKKSKAVALKPQIGLLISRSVEGFRCWGHCMSVYYTCYELDETSDALHVVVEIRKMLYAREVFFGKGVFKAYMCSENAGLVYVQPFAATKYHGRN